MKIKRLLAFILSFAMLLSLLPTVAFASENEIASYNYVFNYKALGASANIRINDSFWNSEYTLDETVSSGKWETEAIGGGNLYQFYEKGFMHWTKGSKASLGANGISFKLSVDKAAAFKPSISYYEFKTGGKFNVYLVDGAKTVVDSASKITEVCEAGNSEEKGVTLLGSFESYNAAATSSFLNAYRREVSFDNFPELNLEAGEYYLVISIDGENSLYAKDKNLNDTDITQISYLLESFALREIKLPPYEYVISAAAMGQADNKSVAESGSGVILRSDLNFNNVVLKLSDRWEMTPHDMTTVHLREGGLWSRVNIEQYPDWKEGGNGICFKLDVPCAGTYETKLTYDFAKNGGIADVYVVDEKRVTENGIDLSKKTGIADVISKFSPVASFDSYNANASDAHMDIAGNVTLPIMELPSGNVYVVITLSGANSKILQTSALRYLELRKFNIGEVELADVSLTLNADRVIVGIEEQLNLKYISGIGKTVSVVGDVVRYTSSDESVLTVSENGLIKGVSKGTAEVTVETSIGGKTYSDTLTINVDELIYKNAEINIIDDEVIFVGNTKELSVSAYFEDGTIATGDEIDVEIVSDDESVAKIEGTTLIPCGEGVVNITANVTFNGETKSVTRRINVETVKVIGLKAEIEEPVVSSFDEVGSKIYVTPIKNDGTVVGDDKVLPKEAEYVFSGKAIGTNDETKPKLDEIVANPEKYKLNTEFSSGVWNAVTRLGGNLFTFYFSGYHFWSNNANDVKLGNNGTVFKITVDEAATYKPKFTYYENKVGAKINVYLVDAEKMTVEKGSDVSRVVESASDSESGVRLLGGFETYNVDATSSWLDSNKIVGEFGDYPSIDLKAQDYYVVISMDEENSEFAASGEYTPGSRIGYYIKSFSIHEILEEVEEEVTEYNCSYENLTPDIISVSDDGYIKYVSAGTGKVKVTAEIDGNYFDGICEVISSTTKTAPTIYTDEMRENAKENARKYGWAKQLVKSKTAEADKYVDNLDFIYGHFPPEGIPRSQHIALYYAQEELQWQCPACKIDILESYGSYPWIVNPITRPWKIQCPHCKRLFPSNDFENFYKLGIQEDGTFSRDLAIAENEKIVAAGGEGYLVNKLYPEMGEGWMVDAGYGWSITEGYAGNKYEDRICPIAYYTHYLWNVNGVEKRSFLTKAIINLRDAYLYTGEEKYGVAGAILVDRFADMYPTYDFQKVSLCYMSNHGGARNGKTVGSASEKELLIEWIRAVDAFYPMAGNPKVVSYLSEKAEELGLENPKLSGDNIRENWDNRILREAYDALQNHKVYGHNGGSAQIAIAAGIALDCQPETNEYIDWAGKTEVLVSSSLTCPIFGVTKTGRISNSGGNLYNTFFEVIDRDGLGPAVGVSYNKGRYMYALNNGELMHNYAVEGGLDILNLPRFVKMFTWVPKFTLGSGYTLSNGDSGSTAQIIPVMEPELFIKAFYYTGNPELAQIYYMWMNGDIDDAYVDMFVDNQKLVSDIKNVIATYGEYEFKSDNLAGYGLGVLRGGDVIKNIGGVGNVENRCDTWMYYGATTNSHAHLDILQMGVDAYGFNFSPDLGYPEDATGNPRRLQWCRATISHNTVVVDGDSQVASQGGYPLHFDDSDRVKVMDVDASTAYDVTDIYRRTTVTVAASEKDAYTVDFFRVKGGNSHTYSFHSQSNMGYSSDDVELVPQVDENGNYIGTYASKDIERGPDPGKNPGDFNETADYDTLYPRGYTYLKNVNRGENLTSGKFTINFEQTDFNGQLKDPRGLNLKFTAVNDWVPDSVDVMTGLPPEKASNMNVPGLDYMMIQRKDEAEELDTLFTSVIQPYKGEEYIDSISPVDVKIKSGKEVSDDEVKAIKVVLKNKKTDYIVYATNNTVTYTVSDNGEDVFDFSGFVGIYTINENGENIYAYVHDGSLCGDLTGESAYYGTVTGFTKGLSDEKLIEVRMNSAVDTSALIGKQIVVENSKTENAMYAIVDAYESGNKMMLSVGDVELIDGLVDYTDISKGYTYNIAEGDGFRIPLTSVADEKPVFTDIPAGITASAGSSVSFKVRAESSVGENVEYIGTVLPRGASIDAATGEITWNPTSSQTGVNGFLITVRDDSGRENTLIFEVTVYGATTGGASAGGSGGGSGAGTSGGGGASSGAAPTDKPSTDEAEETPKDDVVKPEVEVIPGNNSSERFKDIGNYAWAKEAINALADAGVIKGTSADTFSPSANITRADFTILLVRLFKLENASAENFDDVNDSDYFAKELAVARNTGIVNGIGNNKYAPKNFITRQDMMTIVCRALDTLGIETVTGDVASAEEFSDYADVAEYAKEAVFGLIASGIVNGKSGRIAPLDYTTRAEVAVLLSRLPKAE